MAPQAQWIHSFVTDDKIYCLYLADNAETIREHARRGGFPAEPRRARPSADRSDDRRDTSRGRIAIGYADVDVSTPWAAASTSTHRPPCALRIIKSPQHHHPHTTRRPPCTPPSATTWPRPGPPSCAARPSEARWPAPPATRELTSSSMPHLGSRPQGAACSPPCAPRYLTSLPHRRLANALRRSKCHLLRAGRVEQKFHRCSSPSSSYRRSAFGDSRDSRANSPDAHQPMTAP